MDSSSEEITHNFPPFIKVYKDGHVERYQIWESAEAGHDPITGVQSKDVVIVPESGLKARIFIPKIDGGGQKLPLLIHYHGGGFCLGISRLGLAPEHPLPIAYEDSWAALQWVATHCNGLGPEPWTNDHADLGRVFLGGESAGANIAHYVAVQAGVTQLVGLKVEGVLIVHPFFGGKEPDEMYKFLCPTSSGCDDDPEIEPDSGSELE
ncbi:hypothetical protein Patl1_36179 [Pistacia atlantica]|nr:hypothetical protein Patl1_36179 [Pistacia atlantica]